MTQGANSREQEGIKDIKLSTGKMAVVKGQNTAVTKILNCWLWC